jgi:hypothetical protein
VVLLMGRKFTGFYAFSVYERLKAACCTKAYIILIFSFPRGNPLYLLAYWLRHRNTFRAT